MGKYWCLTKDKSCKHCEVKETCLIPNDLRPNLLEVCEEMVKMAFPDKIRGRKTGDFIVAGPVMKRLKQAMKNQEGDNYARVATG